LRYDDDRLAIGPDVGVHRLSPDKAGMDGCVDHHPEIFWLIASDEDWPERDVNELSRR